MGEITIRQGQVCSRDLGIVAKRKLGIHKDDGNSWLEIKNRAYSQEKDGTSC
jgi:hypothetical protein